MHPEISHTRIKPSLALTALALLQACSTVMMDPGAHGQALNKAMQAQRLPPQPTAPPNPPAAVELKGAVDNYLQGRMPAAGGGLTPALGETLR